MTYVMADLKRGYEKGIISSREYIDMAEWLATADDGEDPNEMGLVNLRHALEDGVLSPVEYVWMIDLLFEWLRDRETSRRPRTAGSYRGQSSHMNTPKLSSVKTQNRKSLNLRWLLL